MPKLEAAGIIFDESIHTQTPLEPQRFLHSTLHVLEAEVAELTELQDLHNRYKDTNIRLKTPIDRATYDGIPASFREVVQRLSLGGLPINMRLSLWIEREIEIRERGIKREWEMIVRCFFESTEYQDLPEVSQLHKETRNEESSLFFLLTRGGITSEQILSLYSDS